MAVLEIITLLIIAQSALAFDDVEGLRVRMFSRTNPNGIGKYVLPELDMNAAAISSDNGKLKPTKFIITGFAESSDTVFWVNDLKNAFLEQGDYNVYIIDWLPYNQPPYSSAVENVTFVGNICFQFIELCLKSSVMDLDSVHLIAHSLGAQVAGFVGKQVLHAHGKVVPKITVLDPTSPISGQVKNSFEPLSIGDAQFVEAIHSDSQIPNDIAKSSAHINVRLVTDGMNRACSRDEIKQILDDARPGSAQDYLLCDSRRSIHLYTEVVRGSRAIAYLCDDGKNFRYGNCADCGQDGAKCYTLDSNSKFEHNYEKYRGKEFFTIINDRPPYISQLVAAQVNLEPHSQQIGHLRLHFKTNDDKYEYKFYPGEILLKGGSVHKKVFVIPFRTNEITRINLEWLSTTSYGEVFKDQLNFHTVVLTDLTNREVYTFVHAPSTLQAVQTDVIYGFIRKENQIKSIPVVLSEANQTETTTHSAIETTTKKLKVKLILVSKRPQIDNKTVLTTEPTIPKVKIQVVPKIAILEKQTTTTSHSTVATTEPTAHKGKILVAPKVVLPIEETTSHPTVSTTKNANVNVVNSNIVPRILLPGIEVKTAVSAKKIQPVSHVLSPKLIQPKAKIETPTTIPTTTKAKVEISKFNISNPFFVPKSALKLDDQPTTGSSPTTAAKATVEIKPKTVLPFRAERVVEGTSTTLRAVEKTTAKTFLIPSKHSISHFVLAPKEAKSEISTSAPTTEVITQKVKPETQTKLTSYTTENIASMVPNNRAVNYAIKIGDRIVFVTFDENGNPVLVDENKLNTGAYHLKTSTEASTKNDDKHKRSIRLPRHIQLIKKNPVLILSKQTTLGGTTETTTHGLDKHAFVLPIKGATDHGVKATTPGTTPKQTTPKPILAPRAPSKLEVTTSASKLTTLKNLKKLKPVLAPKEANRLEITTEGTTTKVKRPNVESTTLAHSTEVTKKFKMSNPFLVPKSALMPDDEITRTTSKPTKTTPKMKSPVLVKAKVTTTTAASATKTTKTSKSAPKGIKPETTTTVHTTSKIVISKSKQKFAIKPEISTVASTTVHSTGKPKNKREIKGSTPKVESNRRVKLKAKTTPYAPLSTEETSKHGIVSTTVKSTGKPKNKLPTNSEYLTTSSTTVHSTGKPKHKGSTPKVESNRRVKLRAKTSTYAPLSTEGTTSMHSTGKPSPRHKRQLEFLKELIPFGIFHGDIDISLKPVGEDTTTIAD